MTDWTGAFYGFYTNKKIDAIIENSKIKIQEIGYSSKLEKFRDEISLFSYKNDEMLKRHLEIGYNLDSNDEGCFSVEAKIVSLNGIASLTELDGRSDFDPCDINLMLEDISYLFLILPDFIENSAFCLKIKQLVVDSINQARSS